MHLILSGSRRISNKIESTQKEAVDFLPPFCGGAEGGLAKIVNQGLERRQKYLEPVGFLNRWFNVRPEVVNRSEARRS